MNNKPSFLPLTVYDNMLNRYKPSSIKAFTTNIKRLLHEIFNIDKFTLVPFNDYFKVEKYIMDLEKPSVQQNMIATINAFLVMNGSSSALISMYEDLFEKINKVARDAQKYAAPTEHEENNLIDWNLVIELYDIHREKIEKIRKYGLRELRKYQKYMILALYTMIPPLRGQEYLDAIILKVVDVPVNYKRIYELTHKNLFDIKNNKFIVRYHKTFDTHGVKVIDFNQQLSNIVEKWVELTGSQILIPNLDNNKEFNEPMTQTALTELMFRIFAPNKISTSMLRKIYISEIIKYMSPNERKKLAKIMGHTLESQEFIYNKFK